MFRIFYIKIMASARLFETKHSMFSAGSMVIMLACHSLRPERKYSSGCHRILDNLRRVLFTVRVGMTKNSIEFIVPN